MCCDAKWRRCLKEQQKQVRGTEAILGTQVRNFKERCEDLWIVGSRCWTKVNVAMCYPSGVSPLAEVYRWCRPSASTTGYGCFHPFGMFHTIGANFRVEDVPIEEIIREVFAERKM
jgi:hypothetical protein